jgi:hypothetical protein
MNSILLFLFGCIPMRLLLVYLSTILPHNIVSIPLFLISFGFLYLYFTNGRLNAFEAGGVTWWKDLRIIHGLLYLAAAIYAFQGNKLVWVPLLIDVIFGASSFLIHHYAHF